MLKFKSSRFAIYDLIYKEEEHSAQDTKRSNLDSDGSVKMISFGPINPSSDFEKSKSMGEGHDSNETSGKKQEKTHRILENLSCLGVGSSGSIQENNPDMNKKRKHLCRQYIKKCRADFECFKLFKGKSEIEKNALFEEITSHIEENLSIYLAILTEYKNGQMSDWYFASKIIEKFRVLKLMSPEDDGKGIRMNMEGSVKLSAVKKLENSSNHSSPKYLLEFGKGLDGSSPSSGAKNTPQFNCQFDSIQSIGKEQRREESNRKEGKRRSSSSPLLSVWEKGRGPENQKEAVLRFPKLQRALLEFNLLGGMPTELQGMLLYLITEDRRLLWELEDCISSDSKALDPIVQSIIIGKINRIFKTKLQERLGDECFNRFDSDLKKIRRKSRRNKLFFEIEHFGQTGSLDSFVFRLMIRYQKKPNDKSMTLQFKGGEMNYHPLRMRPMSQRSSETNESLSFLKTKNDQIEISLEKETDFDGKPKKLSRFASEDKMKKQRKGAALKSLFSAKLFH